MNHIICDAIERHNVLELRYSGYSRIVEPHAYGRDKNGDEILRCYQISGGSESGEREGWKLLKVSDVYSLSIGAHSFSVRSNYRENDSVMDFMFCQI